MIIGRIPLVILMAGLVACQSANYEWSQATTLNTIAAYQEYISKYPNGSHVVDAQSRIAALQDEAAWNKAQTASTGDSYQQYLASEPNGAHAQAARDEITSRERTAAWHSAESGGTAQAFQDFLSKYPSGPEADEAHHKLNTLFGFRAELATARDSKLADRKREAFQKRFGKDLQQIEVLQPDSNTRDYHIASGLMSEKDANAVCASIKHEGQACTVVHATPAAS
jgi:outer membrane protein assembly factor BamD (BamD/ComL family)